DLSSGISPEQRMRDLLEEAVLADQLGLDVFAVGEHHRPDFAVSSPAVALAAIAARTQRIRLSSAVTVLSSDDPVRVFQQFAEVDLLSGGRAEIMAGRGSFIESFPLFGYDLDDYDELYAEKLDLLLALRESTHVTWSGRLRAVLSGDDEPHRPRARVAALRPTRVRSAAVAARRRRRRLTRAGRREDPVRASAVRQQPLHRADERRSGRPPGRDAVDRAV